MEVRLSTWRVKGWDLQRARELVYKSLEAAEIAEIKRQALMTEGKPLMPDLDMAMTKGEAAAVAL